MKKEESQIYPRFIEVRQLFHKDTEFQKLEELLLEKMMAHIPQAERKYHQEDTNIRVQKMLNEMCEALVAEEAEKVSGLLSNEQVYRRIKQKINGMEIAQFSRIIRF